MKKKLICLLLLCFIFFGTGCAFQGKKENANTELQTDSSDNSSTIRPTSGIWDFQMSGSVENLTGSECPQGNANFASSGEARLSVSPDGLNAVLNIDGQIVSFIRPNFNDTLYDSYEMTFMTKNEEDNSIPGTVRFSFNAIGQEKIENGKLIWDNKAGCGGTYPFTMELIQATEIPPYVPAQGAWMITYPLPIICGSNSADLTSALYNLPNGSGNMSVTGGGPLPLALNLATDPVPLNMVQNGYSNFYNPFVGNLFLGSYVNPSTSTNVNYTGQYLHIIVNSETSISGTILVTGTDGCSVLVPFNISHY